MNVCATLLLETGDCGGNNWAGFLAAMEDEIMIYRCFAVVADFLQVKQWWRRDVHQCRQRDRIDLTIYSPSSSHPSRELYRV